MRPAKKQSRTAALAAIVIIGAISALAEEKHRCTQSTQVRRIVISIQDRKLALLEGDKVIKTWNTAVGADSTPSPSGQFMIVTRLVRPTYYHPGKVIPPGPTNPLGTRWLGLSLKGFGIHGTNAPKSIGRKASHGCIRMRNRDVEELFALVRVGDVVEIYRESNPLVAQIFNHDVQTASSPVPTVS